MADVDLPVFSFSPNWAGGISEYLEWLTDVLGSMTGHEQRRGVRLSPRRFFEATFNPVGPVRSFLDLWLARFAEQEFLLPLWHDKAKLSAAVLAGGLRLNFDNTYREFLNGGLALLYFNAFRYEVVEITTQDVNGLNLGTALAAPWPLGTVIYPLRPAHLDDPEGSMEALSTRVGDAQLGFRLSRDNRYDDGAESLPLFDGYPVVTVEPNRADNRTVQYARLYEDVDTQIGRLYRRDEAGRAFTTQFYNWQAKGRQAHHELRQALYRLEGRQKAVWMPSFNEDVVLARDLVPGSNRLDIEMIGYRYLGGAVGGRNYITLTDDAGVRQIVNVTGTSIPLAADEDRLNLSANVAFEASAERTGSFVQLVRLDQDRIEITHHTDTEGMTEVSAAFKSFASGRTTAGILVQAAPDGTQTGSGCGLPAVAEESDCLIVAPVFDGWYARARITMAFAGNPFALEGWYVDPDTSNSIFNNFNNIWPATNSEFPGGIPYRVFDPDFSGATIYWCNADVMDSTTVDLRHQFSFAAPVGKNGTFSWEFWDDPAFGGTLAPFAGDSGGDPFLVGRGFPQNWFFNV